MPSKLRSKIVSVIAFMFGVSLYFNDFLLRQTLDRICAPQTSKKERIGKGRAENGRKRRREWTMGTRIGEGVKEQGREEEEGYGTWRMKQVFEFEYEKIIKIYPIYLLFYQFIYFYQFFYY